MDTIGMHHMQRISFQKFFLHKERWMKEEKLQSGNNGIQ